MIDIVKLVLMVIGSALVAYGIYRADKRHQIDKRLSEYELKKQILSDQLQIALTQIEGRKKDDIAHHEFLKIMGDTAGDIQGGYQEKLMLLVAEYRDIVTDEVRDNEYRAWKEKAKG